MKPPRSGLTRPLARCSCGCCHCPLCCACSAHARGAVAPGGIGYREVKALVADVIDARVAPRRERYERLLAGPAEIDARLAAGEQHACQLADQTLARTMAAMGL